MFTSSTTLYQETLVDYTLGKIVLFTTYDVIDKKPKTFISSITLSDKILVDFTLGKIGYYWISIKFDGLMKIK